MGILSTNLGGQSSKRKAAKEFCADRGYEFKIMTEDDEESNEQSRKRSTNFYSRLDGTALPLERYSLPELRGITCLYKMNIGNLETKEKSDLMLNKC